MTHIMTSWLFFSLAAPFLWACTTVMDGALRKSFIKNDLALTLAVSAGRLPIMIAFFLIAGFEVPDISSFLFIMLGGILWTVPVFLYYKALEKEDPSNIAIFTQLVPIFALIMAFFVLGEKLSMYQGIAFLFLILGGALAGVKKLKGVWHLSKAFFLIAIACFLWAASDIIFKKFEPVFSEFLSAFAVYFLGSFLASLFIFSAPKGRGQVLKYFKNLPLKVWLMTCLSIGFGVGGSFLFAYALTLGKASLTAVLMGVQPFFVLLMGLILGLFIKEVHKEDLSKRTLVIKGISLSLVMVGLVFLQF